MGRRELSEVVCSCRCEWERRRCCWVPDLWLDKGRGCFRGLEKGKMED